MVLNGHILYWYMVVNYVNPSALVYPVWWVLLRYFQISRNLIQYFIQEHIGNLFTLLFRKMANLWRLGSCSCNREFFHHHLVHPLTCTISQLAISSSEGEPSVSFWGAGGLITLHDLGQDVHISGLEVYVVSHPLLSDPYHRSFDSEPTQHISNMVHRTFLTSAGVSFSLIFSKFTLSLLELGKSRRTDEHVQY